MTFDRRDPDDPDAPGEPTASDVDAAFAQIVAGWDAEGRSRWTPDPPADSAADAADAADVPAGSRSGDEPDDDVDDVQPAEAAVDEDEDEDDRDDEHFVPPEPPPLPRPQPATVGAIGLFLLGIVLLTVPGLLGLSSQYGMPLGLLSISGALVWLFVHLRQGPPTDSGWDDGAQV